MSEWRHSEPGGISEVPIAKDYSAMLATNLISFKIITAGLLLIIRVVEVRLSRIKFWMERYAPY